MDDVLECDGDVEVTKGSELWKAGKNPNTAQSAHSKRMPRKRREYSGIAHLILAQCPDSIGCLLRRLSL